MECVMCHKETRLIQNSYTSGYYQYMSRCRNCDINLFGVGATIEEAMASLQELHEEHTQRLKGQTTFPLSADNIDNLRYQQKIISRFLESFDPEATHPFSDDMCDWLHDILIVVKRILLIHNQWHNGVTTDAQV